MKTSMVNCQSIVRMTKRSRGLVLVGSGRTAFLFRKDLWPLCYWRVPPTPSTLAPPPLYLPPPLALFLTLNPRFCLQRESGDRGGDSGHTVAFSEEFIGFLVSFPWFLTFMIFELGYGSYGICKWGFSSLSNWPLVCNFACFVSLSWEIYRICNSWLY